MASALPHLLHDAILSLAPDKVVELLESGADASQSPSLPLINSVRQMRTEGPGRSAKQVEFVSEMATLCFGSIPFPKISPVHVVAYALYKEQTLLKNAKQIIQHLIDHGADVNAQMHDIYACHVCGYNIPVKGTAIEFALKLKSLAETDSSSTCKDNLDALVTFLYALSSGPKALASLPKTKVPIVARDTWRNLLLNDLCSNVTLVCGGEEIPAHTCVLASASDYFRQLFTGPWRTQVDDGTLAVASVSAELMRGVLSFIYVGEIEPSLVESQAEDLFSIAQQYFLHELVKQAEVKLLSSIGLESLKRLLLLADLHDAVTLKEQCFAYVRRNKVSALTDPSVACLAAEKPALWAELVKTASANEPAAKRKRRTGS